MNRPRHIWSLFAVCATVLLGAVTWVTATALRLEHAQAEAQQQADFEEKVRLALWRMDSLLTPLIAEESARPASHYQPFYSAGPVRTKTGTVMSDLALPSPLLAPPPSRVLLYFEVGTNGKVNSPEVAFVQGRTLLTQYTTTQHVETATARLTELKRVLSAPAIAWTHGESNLAAGIADNRDILFNAASASMTNILLNNAVLAANQEPEPPAQMPQQLINTKGSDIVQQQNKVQSFRNSAEYQARANVSQQAVQGGNGNYGNQPVPQPTPPSSAPVVRSAPAQLDVPVVTAIDGSMTPVWLGEALVLARRINAKGGPVVQGVWLNWNELKQTLLANIRDLFPQADLRPAPDSDATRGGRMLAAVPAEFVPNALPRDSLLAWTPVRFTLGIAWGGMLLAMMAVAALLYGAVSLSERRGAFVSAVTHELRTPLTTFKMYSEMLADGMVRDETKRKQYLTTLCSEANRLSHLVENVLAYARIERGSARSRVERIRLGDLIERMLPRLQERAERSEMKLVVDADEPVLGTVVHVDAAAIEQILFNLVDNACKYAAPTATEKLIHLEALPDGKFAMLRVRDHGQGISAEGARRLFKPFSKSAQEAAHSAPGIGLGLALCRRLSRSLGGDLRLVTGATRGACFELRLPLSANGSAAALSSI